MVDTIVMALLSMGTCIFRVASRNVVLSLIASIQRMNDGSTMVEVKVRVRVFKSAVKSAVCVQLTGLRPDN